MSTGYARIGLTGDYGVAWLLTRLVGTTRARELMFLSERIDVATAKIMTIGERAEDVFYVTDANGGRLNEDARRRLQEQLVATLDRRVDTPAA